LLVLVIIFQGIEASIPASVLCIVTTVINSLNLTTA
jgi:hypothetical protein